MDCTTKITSKEWAKRYLDCGFRPFPMAYLQDGNCSCGREDCDSKHPAFKSHQTNYARKQFQIEKFWKDEKRNVGLNTGEQDNGKYLCVVDVDNGSDFDSFVSGRSWPKTLSVTTGSGGKHYYFYSDSPFRSTASKVAKNIDIRCANGHIIAPPTLHKSGNRYSWDNWGHIIADLPEWLSDKCKMYEDETYEVCRWARKNRINIMISESDFSEDDLVECQKFELEDIEGMLSYIDADDYERWYRVGAAINSEFGEDGFDTFVEWSKTSDKFKSEEDCHLHYMSFRNTSISIGTVVFYAKNGGWKMKHIQKPFDDKLEQLRQMNMNM